VHRGPRVAGRNILNTANAATVPRIVGRYSTLSGGGNSSLDFAPREKRDVLMSSGSRAARTKGMPMRTSSQSRKPTTSSAVGSMIILRDA
jgi:hypothetical protein